MKTAKGNKFGHFLKKWEISILVVIVNIFFTGCEKERESEYVKIDAPEIQANFQNLVEKRRALIGETLIEHNIRPSTDFKFFGEQDDWLYYRAWTSKHKATGRISSGANVVIVGTSKIRENIDVYVPRMIWLNFSLQDNVWTLWLKGGYLYGDTDNRLSPELHADIKKIFPYHLGF